MTIRFRKIDSSLLCQHSNLSDLDECYYFGEYTARASFGHSQTNQIISNFKKQLIVEGIRSGSINLKQLILLLIC